MPDLTAAEIRRLIERTMAIEGQGMWIQKDHAEQFHRLQVAEEQRKRVESCERCGGTGTLFYGCRAVSLEACPACSGEPCCWCNTQVEEAAQHHEGPHATWCPHYRPPTCYGGAA